MHEIKKPKKSRCYIATVAIGDEYYRQWESASLPSWVEYCDRHDLGLLVFSEELIGKDSQHYKKSNWQRLLIPRELKKYDHDATDICYLDTDVLISPFADSIFSRHIPSKVGVVSQRHNLPLRLELTLRILAFSRNRYISDKYPLDSALFMEPSRIFEENGFSDALTDDYFCSGVLLFNLENYSDLFTEWFYKYPADIQTMTGGDEEPILNYELMKMGKLNILPYEFQALWIYEVAHKYPFLFRKLDDEDLVRSCIEASLVTNNFLHFAGAWHECQLWKMGGFFNDRETSDWMNKFAEYLETPVTGDPKGIIRP